MSQGPNINQRILLRPLYHGHDQMLYGESTVWHAATRVDRIAQWLTEIEHLE